MREVLCGEERASVAGAGNVLPAAADRLFRGHRLGARDRLAAADSLALRRFVGMGLDEYPPDHSTISRTRRLIDVETHREVFTWVLGVLADRGLLKGQRMAVDATTLEANAAMRTIVRRDTGEGYQEFLRGWRRRRGLRRRRAKSWRGWTASARSARRIRSGRVQRTRMRGLRR